MDDELLRQLRGLSVVAPDEFVAARNELAKRLRASGDRDSADFVKQIRRPSWIDHVLDLSAERHVDLVTAFLDAAATTREVQRAALAGSRTGSLPDALRTLRAAQASLASAADRLLVDAGRSSDLAAINARLGSVAADADESARLQDGLLGVAPPLSEATGTATSAPSKGTRAKPATRAARSKSTADDDQLAALRTERDEARRERKEVQRAAVAAAKAARQARIRHEQANRAATAASDAVKAAEAALADAQRTASEAGADLERAESAVEQLEESASELESRITQIQQALDAPVHG